VRAENDAHVARTRRATAMKLKVISSRVEEVEAEKSPAKIEIARKPRRTAEIAEDCRPARSRGPRSSHRERRPARHDERAQRRMARAASPREDDGGGYSGTLITRNQKQPAPILLR
jgi:hypothetical protein